MKVILIAGVTGSGKTKLALSLTQIFNIHLISVDSVQIYKNFSIFSNKPLNEHTHSIMNICDFNDNFDVEIFIKNCYIEIESAFSKNKIPVLVGGTSLYFSRLNFDNYEVIKIFLTKDRLKLYRKLDRRCENMVLQGGLDEVLEMKKTGLDVNSMLGKSIGCRDALILFENMIMNKESYNNLIKNFMDSFKKRTRNYARKQECWFKKRDFVWIDVDQYDAFEIVVKCIDGNLMEEDLKKISENSKDVNKNAKKELKTYVSRYQLLDEEQITKIGYDLSVQLKNTDI